MSLKILAIELVNESKSHSDGKSRLYYLEQLKEILDSYDSLEQCVIEKENTLKDTLIRLENIENLLLGKEERLEASLALLENRTALLEKKDNLIHELKNEVSQLTTRLEETTATELEFDKVSLREKLLCQLSQISLKTTTILSRIIKTWLKNATT